VADIRFVTDGDCAPWRVKGARAFLSRAPAEADLANLCAAVLDNHTLGLCHQLEARCIPYVFIRHARKSVTNAPQHR
jgi:hypothetical protein